MTLSPRLDVLPDAQRALWPALASVPRSFVLYGGTALALRLGHRQSIDFDFFSHDAFDHRELDRSMGWLRSATTLQESADTRTVLVPGAREVKVSFFGGIQFGRVGDPELTEDGVLRIASLPDLAGTKIKALLQRVEAKDYLDVAALLDHVSLSIVLGAARTLFGPAFNPIVAQKALTYFEGGDLEQVPDAVRARLRDHAARRVELADLPRRSARLD